MANEEQLKNDVEEFEKTRQQLMGVSSQKQQLQFQATAMGKSLEALEKTKEKKVYKAVGNILILSDTADVQNELKDQKEVADLRLKSLQKQEDSIVQKLNKLKAKIEGTAAPETGQTEEQQKANSKKK